MLNFAKMKAYKLVLDHDYPPAWVTTEHLDFRRTFDGLKVLNLALERSMSVFLPRSIPVTVKRLSLNICSFEGKVVDSPDEAYLQLDSFTITVKTGA